MDWCTAMRVIKAIAGKYNLGQYSGFEVGAPHATATTSVAAFARVGKTVTSLTRANSLLQQASSAKTLQVFDLSALVNVMYKSE